MDHELISNLIKKHEGLRLMAYMDTAGKLTIGYGCNLDAWDAKTACDVAGLDFVAVRGGLAITQQQAETILNYQLGKVLSAAHSTFPEFDTYPEGVQAVIADLIFNLGLGGFLGFRKTIASLKNRDWFTAADHLKDSAWYVQTKSRGIED